MVNKAKENFWRRMATRRGFRLEKSRQRDPNGTSFGKYKLHPVLTSRWHTADEISRALYFSEGITAHTREVTMNWQEYTAKTKETAVYPGNEDYDPTRAMGYLGLGIAGETGEVVDVIKKQIRKEGSWGDRDFLENMVEEIGDVFWYSAQLMDRLGITFDEVVAFNIDKLAGRKAKGTLKERGPKFNEAPDIGQTYNNGGIVPGEPGPLHIETGGYVVAAKDVPPISDTEMRAIMARAIALGKELTPEQKVNMLDDDMIQRIEQERKLVAKQTGFSGATYPNPIPCGVAGHYHVNGFSCKKLS